MRTSLRMVLAALAIAAGVSGALPKPALAAGDPRPPLSEVLSFSALNELFARVALMIARSGIDFTYADVSNDPYANTTSVTGITIHPEFPWDRRANCIIHAERLRVSSAELGRFDRLQARFELSGVTAPLACVPFEVAGMAAMAEIESLALDRVFLNIDYRFNTAALKADVHMTMPGLAAVSLDLDFAYAAIRDARRDPVRLDLSQASVAVENLGLWEKAAILMPPEMTEPAAVAHLVQDGLTSAFAEMNGRPPQGAPRTPPRLTEEQNAFIQAAAAEAQRFVQQPGSIVVETSMDSPVRLTERTLEDPATFFAAVKPTVNSRPAGRSRILPAALLRAALDDPGGLSDAEKLRAGKALITGTDAPLSPEDGMALLRPLAEAGNGPAALALAAALADTDPAAGYSLAMQAGADGEGAAAGLMDRLEQELTTPAVLNIQAAAMTDAAPMPSPHDFVPVADVRAHALAHLRGQGAVRSYARAYYWALLGQAAKDGAAASLASEIEARMRHRGGAAAEAWQAAAGQARADALAHWLTADYPAKLLGQ